MVSPLQNKREEEIFNHLVERFVSENLFIEDEPQQYIFKMNSVSKSSTIGNMAWAFYYACSNNEQEAINSFKNALHYDSNLRPSVLTSLLSYLTHVGNVSEYVKVLQKELSFLEQHIKKSALPHVVHAHIFNGNMELAAEYVKRFQVDNEVSRNLQGIYSIIKFKEELGVSDEQFKRIMLIMNSIADKNRFPDLSFLVFLDRSHNVGSLVFYTSCKSSDLIAGANLELAYKIADHDDLMEMDFAPMFDYYMAKPAFLEQI